MKTIHFRDIFRKMQKQVNISETSYKVWIKTLRLLDFYDDTILLSSMFESSSSYVQKKFRKEIAEMFKDEFGEEITVKIVPRDEFEDAKDKIILPKGIHLKNPCMFVCSDMLFLCEETSFPEEEKQQVHFRTPRVFCIPDEFKFFINQEEFMLVEVLDNTRYFVITPWTEEMTRAWMHLFWAGVKFKVHHGPIIRISEEREN